MQMQKRPRVNYSRKIQLGQEQSLFFAFGNWQVIGNHMETVSINQWGWGKWVQVSMNEGDSGGQ